MQRIESIIKQKKLMMSLAFIVLMLSTTIMISGEDDLSNLEEPLYEGDGPVIDSCIFDGDKDYFRSGDELIIEVRMSDIFQYVDGVNELEAYTVFLGEEYNGAVEMLHELEILSVARTGEVNAEITVGFDPLDGSNVDGDFGLYILVTENYIESTMGVPYGVQDGYEVEWSAELVDDDFPLITVRFASPMNLDFGYNYYGVSNDEGEYQYIRFLRLEAFDIYGFDEVELGVLPSMTLLSNEFINNPVNYYHLNMEFPEYDDEYMLDKELEGNENLNAVYVDLDDPIFAEFQSSELTSSNNSFDLEEETYYLYFYITNDYGQTSFYQTDNFCIDNMHIRYPGLHRIESKLEGIVDFGYKDFRINRLTFDVGVELDTIESIKPEAMGSVDTSYYQIGYLDEINFNVRDYFRGLNIPAAPTIGKPSLWDGDEQNFISFSSFEENMIYGTMDVVSYFDEFYNYDFTNGVVYLSYGGTDHMGHSGGRLVQVVIDRINPVVEASLIKKEETSVTYNIDISDITGYEVDTLDKPNDFGIDVYYQLSKSQEITDIESAGAYYVVDGDNNRDVTIDIDGLETGTYYIHFKVVDYAGNSITYVADDTFFVEPIDESLRFPKIDNEEHFIMDNMVGFKIGFNDNAFTDNDEFGMMLTSSMPTAEELGNAEKFASKIISEESYLSLEKLLDEDYELIIDLEDSYFDDYPDHVGYYLTYYLEDVDGNRSYSLPVELCRDHFTPSISVDEDLIINDVKETVMIKATDFHLQSISVNLEPNAEEPAFSITNDYYYNKTKEEVLEFSLVEQYKNQIGGQIPEGMYVLRVTVKDFFGFTKVLEIQVKIDIDTSGPDPIPDDIGLQIVIDGKLALSPVLAELNRENGSTTKYYELKNKDFKLTIANSQGKYEIQIRKGLQKIGVFKRNKTVVNEGIKSNTFEYITIYVIDQERNSRIIQCIYKEEE